MKVTELEDRSTEIQGLSIPRIYAIHPSKKTERKMLGEKLTESQALVGKCQAV